MYIPCKSFDGASAKAGVSFVDSQDRRSDCAVELDASWRDLQVGGANLGLDLQFLHGVSCSAGY